MNWIFFKNECRNKLAANDPACRSTGGSDIPACRQASASLAELLFTSAKLQKMIRIASDDKP